MSEAEWKETWYLFDEKRTGSVPKTDFIHIVRSLGMIIFFWCILKISVTKSQKFINNRTEVHRG